MSNDSNIGLSYLSMAIELQWSRVIVICIQLYMFDTLLPPFQIILFLVQFLQPIQNLITLSLLHFNTVVILYLIDFPVVILILAYAVEEESPYDDNCSQWQSTY